MPTTQRKKPVATDRTSPLGSSEENLTWLRERGACYLVGTPKQQLKDFEQHLTDKDWAAAAPGVEVKLCPEDEDLYVLCRSEGRVEKEHAMRRRALRACVRDLIKLKRAVAAGRLRGILTPSSSASAASGNGTVPSADT